jgi:hypothetical protein
MSANQLAKQRPVQCSVGLVGTGSKLTYVNYKFASAYNLDEMVSSISAAYSVQAMEFSDADSRFINSVLGGGPAIAGGLGIVFGRPMALWDLGNGNFLALSSNGVTGQGVHAWVLGLCNINMRSENAKGSWIEDRRLFRQL